MFTGYCGHYVGIMLLKQILLIYLVMYAMTSYCKQSEKIDNNL